MKKQIRDAAALMIITLAVFVPALLPDSTTPTARLIKKAGN